MKCFTFNCGSLFTGLLLSRDEKRGEILSLGEKGPRRRHEKVGLFRMNPPAITNGKLLEAHHIKLMHQEGKNVRTFFVLAKPRNAKDPRILLRIRTYSHASRGGSGLWSRLRGNPEALVRAVGAYGDAGQHGLWCDDLILMLPGDVVSVLILGSRPGSWIVDYQNPAKHPCVMPRRRWDMKQVPDVEGSFHPLGDALARAGL